MENPIEKPKILNDPLNKIFEQIKGSDSDISLELFSNNNDTDDIALKTDLNQREFVITTAIVTLGPIIFSKIGYNPYENFIREFKRHKVSLDRKSRAEFVAINQADTLDKNLDKVANLKTLTDTRK